ncbi:MAG: lipopolysaccharide heptosyltransferase II [bacterium]|nr:lipopolysaccharide heptosyltransferase II [bacterium]
MKDYKKILIIRLSSIGDIVLSSPLIRLVRQRFPQAKIDMLVCTEFEELISANPNLSQVILFDRKTGLKGLLRLGKKIRKEGYDLVIDIHKKLRSFIICRISGAKQTVSYNKHSFLRFLLVEFKINRFVQTPYVTNLYLKSVERFGIKDDGQGLEFNITTAKDMGILEFLRQERVSKKYPLIGLAPGAHWNTKRWPKERFIELANLLIQRKNATIVIFGGRAEVVLSNEIGGSLLNKPLIVAGKVSLMETAVLLKRCNVLVTNDSGVLHIAAAVKTPLVAIFGPTVKEFGYYPYRVANRVISKDLPCKPCTTKGTPKCKINTFDCMRLISTDEVLKAVEELLN